MMRGAARAAWLLACVALLAPGRSGAQVLVQDLLEMQVGNAPGQSPANLVATYDRADLSYFGETFRVGLEFQHDHNSLDQYPYARITQRWLELLGAHGRLRVGNTYGLLGRGLLQRSFQLPGVILTEQGTPSRFGFSRDLDGVLLEAHAGAFALRAVSGQPTAGDISPGFADAIRLPLHSGDLSGGQLVVGPWRSASLGLATMRLSQGSVAAREFASGFVEVDPLAAAGLAAASAPVYFEYALDRPSWSDWWRFRAGSDHSHALYASTGLVWGPLGLSAEWKDYHAFLLGVNDPPSLVREQSVTLLNRTTHVLNARDERGEQIEGTWRAGELGDLTLNASHGEGRLFPSLPLREVEERFAELHLAPPGRRWLDATVFADRGHDTFVGVDRRETYGATARVPLAHGLGCDLDVEHQASGRLGTSFVEHAASVTLRHGRWGSAGITWQRSTDPAEARPGDASPNPRRNWWGGTLATTFAERWDVSLFAGQRRRGLACTAGTCYTVEALEGLSLRVLARL
jgi:hypothetical protein